MDTDRPVEIRRHVLKVGQQRNPAEHVGLEMCDQLQGVADAPTFKQRELLCFNLSESRVLEGTYERIFSEALAYRHGLEVAYAASELGCASWTRRPDVPSDK